MLRYLMIISFSCFFLLIYTNGISQGVNDFKKLTQVLPPSPNAASLGKYGGIAINLSSGAANIDIPIMDYTSNSLKLPVSLSYTNSGFKVDEIASRVGTGWAINAGGVITRTVYGKVDERAVRTSLPSQPTSRQLVDFMDGIAGSESSGIDGQPDIFNFNFAGYTGQFILDTTNNVQGQFMQPLLLSHSNLKVEKIAATFKITTADGTRYFFGENATEYTNTYPSAVMGDCGMSPYDINVPTAWYLTKVIHPNNDTIILSYSPIQFNYKTGVNQSLTYRTGPPSQECISGSIAAPTIPNYTCVNWLQTDGMLLNEINSTAGGKVKFNYVNRNDYNDKLISSLEFYQPGNAASYRIFSFDYTYYVAASYLNTFSSGNTSRPFLSSITEKSPDQLLSKKTSFSYHTPESLPPRLSFAQDHWGFFNGKNNTTLIPPPKNTSLRPYFTSATANRDPDPLFCMKGLLSAITYPTGGRDSIFYEGNQMYRNVQVIPSDTSISVNTGNPYFQGTPLYSSFAVISTAQTVHLSGYCSSTTTEDQDIKSTQVTIVDGSGNVYFNHLITYNQTSDIDFTLSPGTYRIKIIVYGQNTSGGATVTYMPGSITYEYRNVNTGGVRVGKVLTTNYVSNTASIKKLRYAKLASPDISSGASVYDPVYEKYVSHYIPCDEGDCSILKFEYYSMYSYSLHNMFPYAFLPTTYVNVVESFGENYENGGIEHEFTVASDNDPAVYRGDFVIGLPLTSNSWRNGREVYQAVFRKQGNSFIDIKKTFTSYKEDVRVDRTIRSYVCNRKYTPSCTNATNPTSQELDAFDLLYNNIYRKWVYVDTVRTLFYDNSGQNYVEHKEIYEYGNKDHCLLTKSTKHSSNGELEINTDFYPPDLLLNGNAEVARQALVSKYIISSVLRQQMTRGGRAVYTLDNIYGVFSNGLVLPKEKVLQLGVNSNEKITEFYNYDSIGNLLEQAKANDVHEVYLWGYGNKYPVAKIVGTDYNTAKQYINQSVLDNPANDQQLRSELAKLRTNLVNVLVTTYTYTPLIGVTSETDINGKTTYYEYDGLGRLKFIKDQNGKIVKQNDYQYQKPITQ